MSYLLLQGDARRLPLPDESVDAIVTDPPYGQTNESYDSDIACRPEVWQECFRVAKPNAALISFAGLPTYHRIASAIEAGGWRVRQMWGWVYRNGLITSAWPKEGFDRLAPAMDPICYATKGKMLLRVKREAGETWFRERKIGETCSWSNRSGGVAPAASGRWPRTLISDDAGDDFQYFALNPNSPKLQSEKVGHPNQKPTPLMQWIVAKLPGGIILDPFAGSGSTLIAALAEGHRAIGIEIDPRYCEVARRRIERPHAPVIRPRADEVLPLFATAEAVDVGGSG